MKIHRDIEQASLAWLNLRLGKITASEMDALVSPLGKVRTGDGPRTYMFKKLAETWTGVIEDSGAGWAAEQGHLLEQDARDFFALATGNDVEQVAFIESDDGRCGCSPDGLLSCGEGVEIKCPQSTNHIRYLLDGKLPDAYVVQVQFSLWVTGFKRWHFLSYRRGMTALRLAIEPDEKIQDAITEAVCNFKDSFDKAHARLCELNGGPPRPRHQYLSQQTEPTDDGRIDILN